MFLALTQKSLDRWSPSTCDTATILRERSTRFRVERTHEYKGSFHATTS